MGKNYIFKDCLCLCLCVHVRLKLSQFPEVSFRCFKPLFFFADFVAGLLQLSDPRNRNHKSLAIANHNFEIASFSRRNRNEIAVLQVFSVSQ